ncbi:MAG TPA: hypothetical protein VN247_05935 [Arenimonas sp.]|nr:hypothetical protein [Arenimonas sp.]
MNHKNPDQIWLYVVPIFFFFAGISSLVITDLIVVPKIKYEGILQSLWFSKEPIYLFSASIPPALFSFLATYLWLIKKVSFFRGWLSVAAFAWVSLVVNPIIWFLVISSFFMFGFVALSVMFLAGIILQITWSLGIKPIKQDGGY